MRAWRRVAQVRILRVDICSMLPNAPVFSGLLVLWYINNYCCAVLCFSVEFMAAAGTLVLFLWLHWETSACTSTSSLSAILNTQFISFYEMDLVDWIIFTVGGSLWAWNEMNSPINFKREQQASFLSHGWGASENGFCYWKRNEVFCLDVFFFFRPLLSFSLHSVFGARCDFSRLQSNLSLISGTFAFHVRNCVVWRGGVWVISARWFIAFKWSAYSASPWSPWAKQPWNCLNNGV